MAKIFYEHEQLIEKLEKRAGIKFTKTVRDLYFKFGYKKIKLLLIYMRQNNLKINNISIRYLFIGEKHLRHTLMPRVETFEIILKNHILHEITRIIGDRNIIAKPGEKTILVKASEIYLVKRINHSLRKSMKISNYDIRISKNSIFYWIHYLMLGDTLFLFNSLRPKIKEKIFLEAFNVSIDTAKVKNELEKVRILRNKIAHAEQIFLSVGTKVDVLTKQQQDNYPYALKKNINSSFLKSVFKRVIPYIDHYLKQFNKYKQ